MALSADVSSEQYLLHKLEQFDILSLYWLWDHHEE